MDSATIPSVWGAVPFALYLLTIAIVPLFWGSFWGKNRNKLLVAIGAGIPVVFQLARSHELSLLVDSLKEYAAFIALLTSLYVISGGICLRGSLAGTPLVNTAFLALGALLASFVGTTGASMLLIRPLLRANEKRVRKTHLVIFFIFIVSNGGGMLSPLGDPPLFLGFLRGVPFFWTLKLLGPWALVNGALLLLVNLIDQAVLNKEELERPGSQLEEVQEIKEPLRISGGWNALWLLGVIGLNAAIGFFGHHQHWNEDLQKALLVLGLLSLIIVSLATTKKEVRTQNKFSWDPIAEVAVVFLGIFVTMVPATQLLEEQGKSGGIQMTHAWQFFWGSGALSSFLDNAPTYVTFSSLASGVVGGLHHTVVDPSHLDQLLNYPEGALFLAAVSCGSVFMGANTYIGNGPNFMVKAIAEEHQIRMPSFFGYMGWSSAILLPLFVVVTFLFFRG
jgi:Na+/H+ antiporter NhaD/arsenite permease-like protein